MKYKVKISAELYGIHDEGEELVSQHQYTKELTEAKYDFSIELLVPRYVESHLATLEAKLKEKKDAG